MKRSLGPTKKRAPSKTPEVACPHSFVEDEGLNLEVECESCTGAHDLSNSKCLGGVVLALTVGAHPESIILKRAIHKRYRDEAIRVATETAVRLANLSRALSAADPPSDRTCRTCPARREQILSLLRSELLRDPMGCVSEKWNPQSVLRSLGTVRCSKVQGCVQEVLSSVIPSPRGVD
ncbi:MAG TPA: hypothetical protein VJ489_04010 [Thermoplasmata archaeon]|nr:hypothetical protein [Thermoplasmata archaeon]